MRIVNETWWTDLNMGEVIGPETVLLCFGLLLCLWMPMKISRSTVTEDIARGLIGLNKRIAGKLNAQAGLTLKDVKEISLWTV